MASQQSGTDGQTLKIDRKCPTSDPRNWMLFKNVDEALLSRMKLFYVFGKHGTSALFVTHDDEVYGLGCNEFGVLGVNSWDSTPDLYRPSVITPEQLPNLSGNGVVKFASGDHHVLALTRSGIVFAWGSNAKAQVVYALGCFDGHGPVVSLPVEIQGQLAQEVVVDIACGAEHSVALTDAGELYVWGFACASACDTWPSTIVLPQRVLFGDDSDVVAIACTASSTHCAVANGQVFSFGRNDFKQLGTSQDMEHTFSPVLCDLPSGKSVTKLAAGYSHCLALTTDGEVISWGKGNVGQLGRLDVQGSVTGSPWKVSGIGKVAEVAAVKYLELSAALTCDGQVFVWGLGIQVPSLTAFRSLQEAFSHYTLPSITYQPVFADASPRITKIASSLRTAFDDAETSDITFSVGGKTIHAHRAVLKIRCDYFRKMFDNQWRESTQEVIEVESYSYAVYRTFLKYLYTEDLGGTSSVPELIELVALANYVMETELKQDCELTIKNMITVENVASVYAAAVGVASDDLIQFTLNFAARNLKEVMNSHSFVGLEEGMQRNFLALAMGKC